MKNHLNNQKINLWNKKVTIFTIVTFFVNIIMFNNKALLEDLYKLTELKKENKLHFKYYVFIVVGMNKCELYNKINRRHNRTHIDGDIICFCFKDRKVDMFPIKDMKK